MEHAEAARARPEASASAPRRERIQNCELYVAEFAVAEQSSGARFDFEAVARAAADGSTFASHDAHPMVMQGAAHGVE